MSFIHYLKFNWIFQLCVHVFISVALCVCEWRCQCISEQTVESLGAGITVVNTQWMLGLKRGSFEESDMCLTTESPLQPQVLYILIYSVPSHERNKWDCFKYFHMIFPVKGGSSNSYRMFTTQLVCIFKRNIPRTSESKSMTWYWVICPIISVCSTLNSGSKVFFGPTL